MFGNQTLPIHMFDDVEVWTHMVACHPLEINMPADMLHALVKSGIQVARGLGDEGVVIAEPATRLHRQLLSQVADMVFNPTNFVIKSKCCRTALELAEFAPQLTSLLRPIGRSWWRRNTSSSGRYRSSAYRALVIPSAEYRCCTGLHRGCSGICS